MEKDTSGNYSLLLLREIMVRFVSHNRISFSLTREIGSQMGHRHSPQWRIIESSGVW